MNKIIEHDETEKEESTEKSLKLALSKSAGLLEYLRTEIGSPDVGIIAIANVLASLEVSYKMQKNELNTKEKFNYYFEKFLEIQKKSYDIK